MRYSNVEEICARVFDWDIGEYKPRFHCYGMTADVLGALLDAGEKGVVVGENDGWFASSVSRFPAEFKVVSEPATDDAGGGKLIRYILLVAPHVMLCKRANEFYHGRYYEKQQTVYHAQSTWSPFDHYRRRNR